MKSENQTGFSIITPVFNREDCIHRCIESVVAQNYSNIEHWIVDDGSTDNTYSIIEKYASQYPFINYHKFDTNKGVNAARNFAIKNSNKDFIIFLDSDDYFVENAFDTINDEILKNPGYLHYLFAQDDRMNYYNQNPILKEEKAILTFADFLKGNVSGDFAHIMKTTLVQLFPFDEVFRIYEYLTFYQMFKAGEKQLFIKKIVVNRERARFDSVTKESRLNNKTALNNQYLVLKKIVSLFKEDYLFSRAESVLSDLIKQIFILGIALQKYTEIKLLKSSIKEVKVKIPLIYQILYAMRLGSCLRIGIFTYSSIKNKFQ